MSLYIESVRLTNLKCFEEFKLELDLSGDTVPWTLVLGDNAAGKTTLLRAIALGLCDESSAAGLMKESDEGYIRRQSADEPATIEIHLVGRDGDSTACRIVTTITKIGDHEQLRQETDPEGQHFPWHKLFASAYGAARGTAGTGDIVGYTLLNAVYNLFNYAEGLQNPELTIHRLQDQATKDKVTRLLAELSPRIDRVNLTGKGITADGPWGPDMPVRDLADGYKASMLWLTDFIGWAIAYGQGQEPARQLPSPENIQGIVLLDELEQHLHPRWQQSVVVDLRRTFPEVQFFAATHSPLIASKIGQLKPATNTDKILHLDLSDDGLVTSTESSSMRGKRADQVLASRAFLYTISSDRELEDTFRAASELAGQETLSEEEEGSLRELTAQLAAHMWLPGETEIERSLQQQFMDFVQSKLSALREDH